MTNVELIIDALRLQKWMLLQSFIAYSSSGKNALGKPMPSSLFFLKNEHNAIKSIFHFEFSNYPLRSTFAP
jgi:hypothetical protein